MADITPHPVLLANAGGLGEQEDVPIGSLAEVLSAKVTPSEQ